MTRRILSVSYDRALLQTRAWILEQQGYEVVSVHGFTQAQAACLQRGFDLFILGHSIPHADKEALILTFRRGCNAPILSLLHPSEALVDSAEHHISPDDPREMVERISEILDGQERGEAV